MAKAIELSPNTLKAQRVPKAAKKTALGRPKADVPRENLQVRWPAEDIRLAKRIALDLGMNMSDFTLECLRVYAKGKK